MLSRLHSVTRVANAVSAELNKRHSLVLMQGPPMHVLSSLLPPDAVTYHAAGEEVRKKEPGPPAVAGLARSQPEMLNAFSGEQLG
jgi:hypothetical protein